MILSVPHTGTRSIKAMTGHRGIHVHAPDKEIAEFVKIQPPVICPLRNPLDVWVSFYSRRGTGHATNVSMEHCFERLAYLDSIYEIFYVPVDIDPDYQKARLEALLGRDLDEWPHEGHFPHKEVPEKDLSWIYDLPMIKEFYSGH